MTDHGEPNEGSTKPYLLRAIYEWAVDHGMTPQVLVDAGVAEVVVPRDCIKDGRIVLTIHPRSVQGLQLGNEDLLFSTRFAGKPFAVRIPVAAVAAIYCRENGQGIVFQGEGGGASRPVTAATSTPPHLKSAHLKSAHLKPAHLKLVK